MVFTLVGFGEDIDPAGAAVNIAALQDQHVSVSGDNLTVPELSQILALFGGVASGGTFHQRLTSPELRKVGRIYITPINWLSDSDAEPSDPVLVTDIHRNPRLLKRGEELQCEIDTNPSAAAFQWLFVVLGDGVQAPATGEIFTVHATGTTTVTARAWSQVTLTFTDILPVGRYAVVGMRYMGNSAIAGRLIVRGSGWRPGCIAHDGQASADHPLFRGGNLGIWGEFESTDPQT